MSERKIIDIEVSEDGIYMMEGKASDFIAWLQGKVDEIDEEHRHTAFIETSVYDDYGSPTAHFTLKYRRPETDAEMERRIAEEKKRAANQREYDLAQLKRLKERYGEDLSKI